MPHLGPKDLEIRNGFAPGSFVMYAHRAVVVAHCPRMEKYMINVVREPTAPGSSTLD